MRKAACFGLILSLCMALFGCSSQPTAISSAPSAAPSAAVSSTASPTPAVPPSPEPAKIRLASDGTLELADPAKCTTAYVSEVGGDGFQSLSITRPSAADLAILGEVKTLSVLSIDGCRGAITIPAVPNLTEVSANWLGDNLTSLDLSACPALENVSLYGDGSALNAVALPQSLKRLLWEDVDIDVSALASLPNLVQLRPNCTPFDLSVLEDFQNPIDLRIYGDGWDYSTLKNVRFTTLGILSKSKNAQAELDTFAGAAELGTVQINDRHISDITAIIENAPDLKTLLLGVDEMNYEHFSPLFNHRITAENLEDLDKLETNIPHEQLRTLIEQGCTVALYPDYNRPSDG